MSDRIKTIRSYLEKYKIRALFLTNQFNISYLTGFTGLAPNEREAFFLLTLKEAYLFTYSTYYGLYEKGGKNFRTCQITPNNTLIEQIQSVIKKEKIKILGFEANNLTFYEYNKLSKKLPAKLKPLTGIVEKARLIKNAQEISNIKKACNITDKTFSYIKNYVKEEVSEKELALQIERFLKKNSQDIAFKPIVAFNQNSAIPHYMPSKNTKLKKHSLILLDFGAKYKNYCSDITRIIFYKTPNNKAVKIYKTVLTAQKKAINEIKTGITGKEADNITRSYLEKKSLPPHIHGLGHGVGLEIHEAPRLKINGKEILRENMVFSIEPGVYLRNEFGIRIEDLVVLKKNKVVSLTKTSKNIIVID